MPFKTHNIAGQMKNRHLEKVQNKEIGKVKRLLGKRDILEKLLVSEGRGVWLYGLIARIRLSLFPTDFPSVQIRKASSSEID